MVGREKKTKQVSTLEDKISQLPEHLISKILFHLSTKDDVRTSVLSTKWRYLWQQVPGLDLDSYAFSNFYKFVRFVESFIYSNNESWIRKLRLYISHDHGMCDISSWIDAVARRRIHHIDLSFDLTYQPDKIPPLTLRLYTCETLVHLRLYGATLVDAEFVALPCLKILHLEYVSYPNESTLEKLISGSPVLKDLTIIRYLAYNAKVLRVRSQTVKKIHIDHSRVVIDAPLLQSLRTKIYKTKNFEIINLGFFTKLDIDVVFISHRTYYSSMIHDIITDISMVKELVINNGIWKDIFLYSKSGPVQQFRNLSSLNAGFTKTDLELLPLILESCPKLESLTLELVEDQYMRCEKNKEPNVMFSTVPQCLVSSLKFVELKRSIPMYEGEMELVRYLLKNSTILKKLRLDLYYSQRAMGDFLKELFAMPKCSTGCEVLVL
ncbi:F-box/FBD/LRR-repeat protein At1g51370-like [Arabidopsis lyrata subsp. lyrata]|uniref:F-box/FBD/LRR-repeat protein At1g51370-like n=1 Tax=Arabidopsis lyrata subsp. lyrata TaxID=81972 RepID=UPI000A29B123|nr:F-box/FBD/LRR-repeat protein At1g51370-like [Arabidopsis lyrata subsp. lyrata]|eukprot:XP_020871769.1 F-box/FBD/LRR-repeat protein At1g51370-like [Arabidopsis lyrata subsp. lyrata]